MAIQNWWQDCYLVSCRLKCYRKQEYTVAVLTKFCMVLPVIGGILVRNLPHITLMALRR